jgi:hypothetical protein
MRESRSIQQDGRNDPRKLPRSRRTPEESRPFGGHPKVTEESAMVMEEPMPGMAPMTIPRAVPKKA